MFMANSLEEEDVVRVNSSDRLLDPLVERKQAGVLDIRRLVEWVVARYPGVALVVLNVSGIPRLKEPEWSETFSRTTGGTKGLSSLPPQGAPR